MTVPRNRGSFRVYSGRGIDVFKIRHEFSDPRSIQWISTDVRIAYDTYAIDDKVAAQLGGIGPGTSNTLPAQYTVQVEENHARAV